MATLVPSGPAGDTPEEEQGEGAAAGAGQVQRKAFPFSPAQRGADPPSADRADEGVGDPAFIVGEAQDELGRKADQAHADITEQAALGQGSDRHA